MKIGLIWFRQDLRLADNPAFHHACRSSDRLIPLFIDDPHPHSVSRLGGASRVWLHHSLASLSASMKQSDLQLIIQQGDPLEIIPRLVRKYGVSTVYWNRCYDPYSVKRDTTLKQHLQDNEQQSCHVESYNASLLYEPWQILKQDGEPYRVFTPFWNMVQKTGLGEAPLSAPQPTPGQGFGLDDAFQNGKSGESGNGQKVIAGMSLEALELIPEREWPSTMMQHWEVGETVAQEKLEQFLDGMAVNYSKNRDIPSLPATSRLSPHLHFGEISPRLMVFHAVTRMDRNPAAQEGLITFIKEVVWREFAYHLMYHFPHSLTEPLNKRFTRFPWLAGQEANLQAWQQGKTGIPIIDAGMRELWQTGWMHNRVRMIVASFLTKNLLIPWQQGEAWFRDTLVDADLASNALGWQWVAGSGADAAPYFRIFNPVLQSRKFDPQGVYLRRWVPEISALDNRQIHLPMSPPAAYPEPLVDLKFSRERALQSYQQIR